MPAGPSELLVFADSSANAKFVASDLLSQAEHGADSQVLLVTTSEEILNSVEQEINKQLEALPRKDIAEKAMQNSRLILVRDITTAMDLINEVRRQLPMLATSLEALVPILGTAEENEAL